MIMIFMLTILEIVTLISVFKIIIVISILVYQGRKLYNIKNKKDLWRFFESLFSDRHFKQVIHKRLVWYLKAWIMVAILLLFLLIFSVEPVI
jgi:hypothetical protein